MKIKKLEHKIILYIPLVYGDGNIIEEDIIESLLDYSLSKLIDLGGGATVLDSIGYWKEDKKVNKMKTKLIIVYVDDINRSEIVIEEVSRVIKMKTKSDSICYEIDGKLYFV